MIQSTIRMTIPSKKRAEALKILNSVAEQCMDLLGCLSCHFYGELREKDVLMLVEIWRSAEDLSLYLLSEGYRNLLLALKMALKQPEIRFDTISSSKGIETIEKAGMHAR